MEKIIAIPKIDTTTLGAVLSHWNMISIEELFPNDGTPASYIFTMEDFILFLVKEKKLTPYLYCGEIKNINIIEKKLRLIEIYDIYSVINDKEGVIFFQDDILKIENEYKICDKIYLKLVVEDVKRGYETKIEELKKGYEALLNKYHNIFIETNKPIKNDIVGTDVGTENPAQIVNNETSPNHITDLEAQLAEAKASNEKLLERIAELEKPLAEQRAATSSVNAERWKKSLEAACELAWEIANGERQDWVKADFHKALTSKYSGILIEAENTAWSKMPDSYKSGAGRRSNKPQ